MDMLQTDQWLTPILFTRKDLNNSLPINKFFDDNGFGSCVFVLNLGSSFVYTLLYIGLMILANFMNLVDWFVGNEFKCLRVAANWLDR